MMCKVTREWILAVFASLSMAGMFVFAWSWVYSKYTDPVVAENNVVIPSYVYAGDSFQLCRTLGFERDISLRINRWLVSTIDGVEINYSLPTASVTRQRGSMHQCRYINVPRNILPGKYKLNTSIEYTSWPFWHNYRLMPSVTLTVMER